MKSNFNSLLRGVRLSRGINWPKSHAISCVNAIAVMLIVLCGINVGCDNPTYESSGDVVITSKNQPADAMDGTGSQSGNSGSRQQEEKQQEGKSEKQEQESKEQADEIKDLNKQAQSNQEQERFPDSNELKKKEIGIELGENWIRPMKSQEIWVDMKKKEVLVGGYVCLRGGVLEMFACPEGTKEHESVIAVFAEPEVVHTALVAIGAEKGNPVQYDPTYKPASGAKMTIEVMWKKDGKVVKRNAKEMIRQIDTGEPLKQDWVFGGSALWKNTEESKPYYLANGGEFICVSNFPSAMMDLPIKSTTSDVDLLFEAFTDKIPPMNTRVLVKLVPEIKKEKENKEKDSDKTDDAKQNDKKTDEKDGGETNRAEDDGK